MVKWFQNPVKFEPTALEQEAQELRGRLKEAELDLRLIEDERKQTALRAAQGDKTARLRYLQLDKEQAIAKQEVELIKAAIAANKEAQDQEKSKIEAERRHKREEQQKKALDAWEAEQREKYEIAIKRFERQGDKAQAAIWRYELSKLRATLETFVR